LAGGEAAPGRAVLLRSDGPADIGGE